VVIKKRWGIGTKNEIEESVLESIRCDVCGENNQATNEFCKRCHLPIGKKNIKETMEQQMTRAQLALSLDKLLPHMQDIEKLVKISEVLQNEEMVKKLQLLQNPKIFQFFNEFIKNDGDEEIKNKEKDKEGGDKK
jgi:predicted amidophosphoribosyltransferase